jgi:hypothetical protein
MESVGEYSGNECTSEHGNIRERFEYGDDVQHVWGVIAKSGNDLWDGTLSASIIGDEDGLDRMFEVWTGTDQFGGSHQTLGAGGTVAYGVTWQTDSKWVDERDGSLATYAFRLYGASIVVTKPLTEVPEPSSVILLSLGLAGLSFARYRKQY